MSGTEGSASQFLSYVALRRIVSILGISLPIIVAVWGLLHPGGIGLQDSISDYYAFRTRDAFVGILFVIAWFLLTYRGYELVDDIVASTAGVLALGVALLPNDGLPWEQRLHFISGACLFVTLAAFSLVLFTKSAGTLTSRKRTRNLVYRVCGVGMLVCIALIGLYCLMGRPARWATLKPVFWLEAAALWLFGVSWFIRGRTLLQDQA